MTQKRILLIDDDRSGLAALRNALDQAGYETLTATDGFQGLTLARSWSPDLVVLDLLLPGCDGFQICESLKGDPSYAHIPIIALTRLFILPEDVEQGLEVGGRRYSLMADAYLARPVVYEQLLQEVRILLGEETAVPAVEEEVILVIDEDDLSRQSLERALIEEGFSVVTASDGEDGWAFLQSFTPSLVIADVHAPGLSGLEVLQRIRQQVLDVAVIMVTTLGTEGIALQAMQQGADAYLVKPFQPWQAVLAVQENLEKARLRCLNRELTTHLRHANLFCLEKYFALQDQDTAVRDAFEAFHEAEQRRRHLVSMVVHDLKNPLNVILISADLLAGDFGEVLDESRRNILSNTKDAGQRMLGLLTNLLEMQRLEDGRMPVRLAPLDLPHMLTTAVRQVQPLAERKAITLCLDAPSSLPLVLADSDLSLRVVTNLLDNAVKFTSFEGYISLIGQVADTGGEVVVTVADNGPGIPPHEQTRVFEAFTQADQSQARGKGSVGLGLAFCKLAVEAQGGRIWVESDEGQGAQFKFVLPVCPDEGMPAEEGDGRPTMEKM